ncbi:helix-turn-helix transcriptional regulator [Paenibacillus crassostreae]|uniref:Transcriptional regulator n=1 Tax=Paenibacillus crassostreae TaxID=1763538 RepID=A0A162RMC9_9BACL|nr:metalloregulator ArsR/SmtB family transcription factor [Paenibacillus crassostreae]AOZ91830.1 ArsR family transcriptional regulator [Paenibacillus crassostreae]OAB73247.1 transcriptional regulator [Paenibacillus crassostreae]
MNKSIELSTREQILHMLKTKAPLTAKDITNELQITEMAVRRHLSTLDRDGYIEYSMLRPMMGRPTATYRLSELAEAFFPKTYHTLTLDLLEELKEESGEDMINLLFERRKIKLEQKYEHAMAELPLSEKVRQLTQIQNDNGYMAEYEEDADGTFVIKEHNCPISHIANQYNHACHCELELFQSLLQVDVQRTECLSAGGTKCAYVISKSKVNS